MLRVVCSLPPYTMLYACIYKTTMQLVFVWVRRRRQIEGDTHRHSAMHLSLCLFTEFLLLCSLEFSFVLVCMWENCANVHEAYSAFRRYYNTKRYIHNFWVCVLQQKKCQNVRFVLVCYTVPTYSICLLFMSVCTLNR